MKLAAPAIAAGLTLVLGSILFLALGLNPLTAFHAFFIKPLSTANGISEWLLKASPLILIALGLAIGFRANVWNIGAEGQFIIGAITSAGVALFLPIEHGLPMLALMLIAGIAGGMFWAAVPAFLRLRYNANEILVTLMLSYVATLFLSYLVHGPWRDPMGFNYPQTALFPPSALFPPLVPGYRVNTSVFITCAALFAAWLFADRSFLGFKMRVGGIAPSAARYAGFRESESVWLGLLISGAAAGAAGMMEAAGPLGQLSPQISPGYGFAAIIVAFVGRLHAVGILFAGLLMSLLYLGGESLQINLNLPASLTRVFQGMLLFFLLAADFLIFYRISFKDR